MDASTGSYVQWSDTKTLALSSTQDTRESIGGTRIGSTKPLGFDESQCDGRWAAAAAAAAAIRRSCMSHAILLVLEAGGGWATENDQIWQGIEVLAHGADVQQLDVVQVCVGEWAWACALSSIHAWALVK